MGLSSTVSKITDTAEDFAINRSVEISSKANLIENANHVINDVAKPCASVGVPATVSKTANIDKSQQSTFMTAPGSTSEVLSHNEYKVVEEWKQLGIL